MFSAADRPTTARAPSPIAILAMAILAPFAAMLIQMADLAPARVRGRPRRREIAGSPTGLANALRRIDAAAKQIPLEMPKPATAHMFIMNPFTRQGLMSLFSDAPADRGAHQGADGACGQGSMRQCAQWAQCAHSGDQTYSLSASVRSIPTPSGGRLRRSLVISFA